MQLGSLLPLGDIGGDPAVLREYAQAAETTGYHFIEAPDHVLGANPVGRPDADRTGAGLYHDPFVLFGYLAGVAPKLGFSTGVLILPQRQTALVAKQAACLDALCAGRFRLGIGDGWMPNAYPPDQSALDVFGQLRRLTEQAGRDPARVGIEVWVSMGSGSEADWAKEARFWKAAGASHLCLTTTFNRRHHHRIAGHGIGEHIAALRRYQRAVADAL